MPAPSIRPLPPLAEPRDEAGGSRTAVRSRRSHPVTPVVGRAAALERLDGLDELATLIAPLFARREPRRQALLYVRGLLGTGPRKTGRQMAGMAGEAGPWGTQRLLHRARWDADAMRDLIRSYAVRALDGPDSVLALGTGEVLKKGAASVGVGRQYAESTRQLQNCQLSVLAAYCATGGSALIDRELYLPGSWVEDPVRCIRAGVPESRIVARGPSELAGDIISRAIEARVPLSWVSACSRLGRDPEFRRRLRTQGLRYVLAVPPTQLVRAGGRDMPLELLAERVPAAAWRCYQPAEGDLWMSMPVPADEGDEPRTGDPNRPGLLVHRRAGGRPTYRLVHAPPDTATAALAAAAQAGPRAGSSLRAIAGQIGLDSYQVRTWTAWYRHVTLCMLALLRLADVVGPAEERATPA